MFMVMPGSLTNNDNFDMLKVAVFSERQKDEIMRLPLSECGDGKYNSTAVYE